MYDQPIYVWALVLIGVIGIPATASAMLYRGALATRLRRRTAAGVALLAAGLLGTWIVISAVLAGRGVYADNSGGSTAWFGAAFAGVLITLLLATRIPLVSRILSDPGTPARLAVPHTLRVVGVLFLIAMALGDLPAIFALPAGLGDIAIGIAAPFVARRLVRESDHKGAVRFNVLGIVDLVVALSVGFLAGLGPWLVLDVTPSTEALVRLPFALVPTAAVPLAIALHIVSLHRLRVARADEERPGASQPQLIRTVKA